MLVWFGFIFKRWRPHVVDVGFELILLPLPPQLQESQFTAFSFFQVFCFVFEAGSYPVIQAGLEVLAQPSGCWDYTSVYNKCNLHKTHLKEPN